MMVLKTSFFDFVAVAVVVGRPLVAGGHDAPPDDDADEAVSFLPSIFFLGAVCGAQLIVSASILGRPLPAGGHDVPLDDDDDEADVAFLPSVFFLGAIPAAALPEPAAPGLTLGLPFGSMAAKIDEDDDAALTPPAGPPSSPPNLLAEGGMEAAVFPANVFLGAPLLVLLIMALAVGATYVAAAMLPPANAAMPPAKDAVDGNCGFNPAYVALIVDIVGSLLLVGRCAAGCFFFGAACAAAETNADDGNIAADAFCGACTGRETGFVTEDGGAVVIAVAGCLAGAFLGGGAPPLGGGGGLGSMMLFVVRLILSLVLSFWLSITSMGYSRVS